MNFMQKCCLFCDLTYAFLSKPQNNTTQKLLQYHNNTNMNIILDIFMIDYYLYYLKNVKILSF